MRFTLDGEQFELSPESVRAGLDGRVPEEIHEHWVEVDGTRWPVKQVIAAATGLSRTRFQSQTSRRLLERLGFPVGRRAPGEAAAAPPRRVPAARRPLFEPGSLRPVGEVAASIAFTWLGAGAVTLDGAGLPHFPPLPPGPGLYRLDFGRDDEGVRTLYIGESVSLRRRASDYRNARTDRTSQRTSRRIHLEIVAQLTHGRPVDIAVATGLRLGGGEHVDLRLRSARRLAENAAVLQAQLRPATALLNLDVGLDEAVAG